MNATITKTTLQPAAARPIWTSVATHTHLVRNPQAGDEVSRGNLLRWAAFHHVGAAGVGSPWTKKSSLTYRQNESENRDRYYAGLVDPSSVMDREDIEEMLRDLNASAGGKTYFYLDNETPKQHFGHLWHIGFEYQVPAWHDYDQDRDVSYSDLDPILDPNSFDRTGAHIRRTYSEVVARQRKAGAISVWAHPTSWWWGDSQGSDFVTNIASEMLPELYSDGFLNGLTVQGYDPFHVYYQKLWFELQDRGWKVPGFSEMDLCPGFNIDGKGTNLFNYLPGVAGPPSMDTIQAFCRASRHVMSSGIYLTLEIDGHPTGTSLASGAGFAHRALVTAFPVDGESVLGRVELLGRGGEVLAFVENFQGGTIEFHIDGDANGGYLVARAVGEHDGDYAAKPQQQIQHCAITNPVYLDAPFTPHPVAIRTELTLQGKDYAGAPMRLVDAAGDELLRGEVPSGTAVLEVPGTARLEVTRPDGTVRTLPLSMTNRRVRDLMDYLAKGRFVKDFEGCVPGVVPIAAFRMDEMAEALSRQTLVL